MSLSDNLSNLRSPSNLRPPRTSALQAAPSNDEMAVDEDTSNVLSNWLSAGNGPATSASTSAIRTKAVAIMPVPSAEHNAVVEKPKAKGKQTRENPPIKNGNSSSSKSKPEPKADDEEGEEVRSNNS